VREESFFQTAEEDQGKFQAFGGVQAHEGDLRACVVVVSVADQRRVVEELVKSFGTVTRIHGSVDQFTQVFNARVRFGSVFFFEKFDVASAVDEEF
jgi:hypothetical protein